MRNSIPQKNCRAITISNSCVDRDLFIGRLSSQKGIDILLDAVVLSDSKISLDIAGPIQQQERKLYKFMDQKIQELNSKGHDIKYIGPVEVNSNLLKNYKLVILPSRFEGLPYLVLELLNLGMPMLLSDCPGHQEFKKWLPDSMFFSSGCSANLLSAWQRFRVPKNLPYAYSDALSDFTDKQFEVAFNEVIKNEF